MTDEEIKNARQETLDFLQMMADQAKGNRLNVFSDAATIMKQIFDSYLNVGFTREEALELLKVNLEMAQKANK